MNTKEDKIDSQNNSLNSADNSNDNHLALEVSARPRYTNELSVTELPKSATFLNVNDQAQLDNDLTS